MKCIKIYSADTWQYKNMNCKLNISVFLLALAYTHVFMQTSTAITLLGFYMAINDFLLQSRNLSTKQTFLIKSLFARKGSDTP